jgi:hypothetical protein
MLITWLAIGCLALGLAGCKRTGERNDPLVETAKACARHGELSCPRPILHVRSLRASQRYYRDALGFKIDWEHGDPPDFGSVSPGSWMMIFTANVDRLHREIAGKGAIIKLPPTNMPWGMREMQVADPDGNVIRFGSAIEE